DDKHLLTAHDVERGEHAEKLDKLKTQLKVERSVNFFTSIDDLFARVIDTLSHLSPGTPHAITPDPSPYDPRHPIFFVPYRSKGKQVVGRASALDAVRNQLL